MNRYAQLLSVLLLGITITCSAQAQSNYATFFLTVTDSNYEPNVTPDPGGGVMVSFNNTTVDSISAQYTFLQFHRAYPNSIDPNLADVFIIEASSPNYVYDLIE